MTEVVLQLGLERVIDQRTRIAVGQDVGKVGNRPPIEQRRAALPSGSSGNLTIKTGAGLVEVFECSLMYRVVSDIRDFQRAVPWHLLLHREMECLHIRRFEVPWQIAGLRLGCGEIRGTGKVGLVTVLHPAEACGRVLRQRGAELLTRRLVGGQGRVVVVRSVVSEQTLSSHTKKVGITDAIATANHSFRRCLIREAYARAEVLEVQIDQTAIRERIGTHIVNAVDVAGNGAVYVRTMAGSDQPVVRRVKIIELIVLFIVRRHEFITQTQVQGQRGQSLPVVLNISRVPEAEVVHLVRRI